MSNNSQIKELKDLVGQNVTGDRDSSVEAQLERLGLKGKIRLKATTSKEESMKLLKSGRFVAMIVPKEVGLYLAKKQGGKVKIIEDIEQTSPVGIAVKRGNLPLLNLLNDKLNLLSKAGEIEKLYQKWFR